MGKYKEVTIAKREKTLEQELAELKAKVEKHETDLAGLKSAKEASKETVK